MMSDKLREHHFLVAIICCSGQSDVNPFDYQANFRVQPEMERQSFLTCSCRKGLLVKDEKFSHYQLKSKALIFLFKIMVF